MRGHTGEIYALCHENGKLISGGKDNKIVIYTTTNGVPKVEKSIDVGDASARGIDYYNGKILVGLRSGSIFEINEQTEEQRLIMASHHEGEAWGIEMVPQSNSLFSIGDDNKILEFDFD